jgi:DNA-binding CsgD family transcriptional regulator
MQNDLLSQREREIAALVATGASNKEIARHLAISVKTVNNTLTNIFCKTGARSRTELAIQLVRAESGAPHVEYGRVAALESKASFS